jgi:hypothetical protein
MPWAAWAIAALLAVVWVPVVGEWASRAIIILTLVPIGFMTTFFQHPSELISGPVEMTVAINNVAAPGERPPNMIAVLWEQYGWPGVVWLVVLAVLGLWVVLRIRAQRRVRSLVNALILIAGWPGCFWAAVAEQRVIAHAH